MRKFIILCIAIAFGMQLLVAQKSELTSASITFTFPKNVKGSIAGFESTSQIDLTDLTNSIFAGTVDVATLDTNNSIRNWHLKRKYFKKDAYPKISFTSTAIVETGNTFEVTGNLTIKATTKIVTISFKKNGDTLTGTTSLYATDYDINIKKKREDNKVDVTFVFTLGR